MPLLPPAGLWGDCTDVANWNVVKRGREGISHTHTHTPDCAGSAGLTGGKREQCSGFAPQLSSSGSVSPRSPPLRGGDYPCLTAGETALQSRSVQRAGNRTRGS
ncbi:rab3 GTPase-activating protein catalytic subunit [Platysternon megacephalum]|uniref:Rab3 GTPase-activating protein catalytic subunit n=1 Tax=Platysternon megacephalum TaxID=55544 RepID=A0A4D9EUC6_9SAUR|nr:rab3 GTPase-activating protein catalytic subunit [Platysternon megacephalum]